MRAPAPTLGRLAALLVLAAAGPRADAQVRLVDVLYAGFTEATDDSTGRVLRMSGDVRLRQDTTLFWAQNVTYYETAGLVDLVGDVRVVSGRDTLTARRVAYDSNTKVVAAEGDVRVGNGESTLFAPSTRYDTRAEASAFEGGGRILTEGAVIRAPAGTYDSPRRFARLTGPVSLHDSSGTLHAARGTYDARVQRADFAGDVRLRRPDARLVADSVVYFRRTERARAYGHVVLERIGAGRTVERLPQAPADSSSRTFLFGDQLVFDGEDDLARVRGTDARDPLLMLVRADSTGRVDTTLARAPRIDVRQEARGADTVRVLVATGGVRMTQRELGARADSVRLERLERPGAPPLDRYGFYGRDRPRLWADGAQLTADTLRAQARGEAVDTVFAVGSPFAARLDSTLGRVQQLRGRRMQALLDGDRVRRLDVWPNAEAIVHQADGEGRLEAALELSSDSLSFRFEGGEVRAVDGSTGTQGKIVPGALVTSPLRLGGFAFSPRDAPRPADLLGDGWEAAWIRASGPTPADLRPPAPTAQVRPPDRP